MFNRNNRSHVGAWLEIDDEDKTVEYRVDPDWLEYTDDEERKSTLAKLAMLATVYLRVGYAVFGFVKNSFFRNGRSS